MAFLCDAEESSRVFQCWHLLAFVGISAHFCTIFWHLQAFTGIKNPDKNPDFFGAFSL